MSNEFYIGIDPGQKGAIAVLTNEGNIELLGRFSGQNPAMMIKSVISSYKDRIKSVAVEKVHAMPGQGVSSMFAFGVGYGRILGALDVLDVSYSLVSPQSWQKVVKYKEDLGPKERAAAEADILWGKSEFIFERCKTPDSGCIDAALIAYYLLCIDIGSVAAPKDSLGVKRKKKKCMVL